MRSTATSLACAALFLTSTGCSLNTLMVNQMSPILRASLPALEEEADFDIAKDSIPAQLKVIEGFLQSSLKNRILLELLARGWGNYAFGFIEDEIEQARNIDPEREEALIARGRALYLRGMDYGLRLLALDGARFADLLTKSPDEIAAAVHRIRDPDLVPGLFWTGFGLAGAINLGRDQPELIVQLPKVEAIMKRVLELDERFFYAAPHLALGSFYASRIPLFGGEPEKGKAYFERAIELTHGRFLMHKVLYAFYYAHTTQNRELFERLLHEVLDTPADVLPEQQLANVVAHRRAERYLARIDTLF